MCCFFILLFNLLFHLNISAANAKCVPITLPVKHFQTTKYIVTVFYIFIFGLDQSLQTDRPIRRACHHNPIQSKTQSYWSQHDTTRGGIGGNFWFGETLPTMAQNKWNKKTFEWKGQPIWCLPTAVLVTLGYFRTNCNLYFRLYLGFSLRGQNWHGLKDLVS